MESNAPVVPSKSDLMTYCDFIVDDLTRLLTEIRSWQEETDGNFDNDL